MDKNAQFFAGYWRNSLVDSIFAKGGLDSKDIEQFLICDLVVLENGQISNEFTQQLFENEPEDRKTIEVSLRPKVYRNIIEHTFAKKDIPEFVVPVATNALLARNGRLYPLNNETIISRDILEPLVKGSFSVGSVDNLDLYLTSNIVSGINYREDEQGNCKLTEEEYSVAWKTYLKDCDSLLKAIAKDWLESDNTFESLNYGYIIKKDVIKNAAMHIVSLYDKLRDSTDDIPLFSKFASKHSTKKQPCLAGNSLFSKRVAHSGDQFPLADAQRDALNHFLSTENGEILAVNGPPGTGKTTMLLSVVASIWAQHALDESEPPVIVAASTNNQAVTNVIDAFGKDFSIGEGVFAGRWLPDIASFGAYYPSRSKSEKAEKIYQTESFFTQIETQQYYEKAKQHYINCALQAFPELDLKDCSVKDIVNKLHQALKKEADKLEHIEKSWQNLSNLRQEVKQLYGDSLTDTKNKYDQQLQTEQASKSLWQNVETSWLQYLANESIWLPLFSWIPAVAQKRLSNAKLHLKKIWPAEQKQQWKTINSISQFVENKLNTLELTIQKNQKMLKEIDHLILKLNQSLNDWHVALQPLGITDKDQEITFTQVDTLTDIKIRFHVFLLTTHYWEGRWLMDMEELLPDLENWKRKNGAAPTKKRWYLRMKLTPCIVSTFFMLPDKFIYTGAEYKKNYLYNFADLLIVDEAGQVLPEVAGASFSLSKKALIIGDTFQTDPIWSVPPKVDIGNLQKAKIICSSDIEEEYEHLKRLGKTASFGSVMRIAQQASNYHYDPEMEPGMFLYEHRRCYDEIIGFCNELVYKGKLKPMRGSSPEKANLPALGYLHIDGVCQKAHTGSRFNKLEATVIAKWLVENKDILENQYKEPINKIVGIVTPFGAQVAEIKRAIKESECGINIDDEEDSLTVGTIHSLQGAERKIIIFSMVYSKHANGNFIDDKSSKLNVAISRAKDSFLVFGDMDILDPSSKSPRGALAKYLFANQDNELFFEYIAREDLVKSSNRDYQIIKGTEEHDTFLQNSIKNAQKEILIVSPWVRLAAIEITNILNVMEIAVKKGVKVSVYTDHQLNTSNKNEDRQKEIENELSYIMTEFKNKGIEAKFVKNVHSKLVIKDYDLLCIGSFNWLGAQRKGRYVRHETSIAYQGKNNNLVNEIKLLKSSFESRFLKR